MRPSKKIKYWQAKQWPKHGFNWNLKSCGKKKKKEIKPLKI